MMTTLVCYSSSGDAESFTADTALAALELALIPEPEIETFITWHGTEELCALDLDVEPGTEYDDVKLLVLLESMRQSPSHAWVTHGGGLRLMFHATEIFAADEITAVAALTLSTRCQYQSLELKHDTRHPRAPDSQGRRCSTLYRREQSFDRRALSSHLGVLKAGDSDVAAWLETLGFELGGRYEHVHCPIAPSDKGGRKPVSVLDGGIYCFVCEADGICAGSTKPGFFPFAHFCGRRRSSHLYRCLENATHWEQARFVLDAALDLPAQYTKLVYSAGVAMMKSRDEAKRVFATGRDFVRIGDRWTNLSGETYQKDVKPLLSQLPACNYRNGDGSFHVDRGRVATFEQTFDLAKYGYPSLVPVFGCRMWPHSDGPNVTAVIQIRELAGDEATEYRPKYVPIAQRMPELEMWAEFERPCPGLSRGLLTLLVAARGIAEGASSMPPMIFVTGPTRASKSMTPFLAASVCGDRNTEIVWTTNGDRLRQAIVDAAAVGAYVTFNEVIKEARRQVREQHHAMDYVLNLTPDSVSHYMYVGPVRLGRLPVFVWTDTELPTEIKTDAQLARRIVHVHLPSQISWESSLEQTGVRHPRQFRSSSERRCAAANALLSLVIDRFLRPPMKFSAIAQALGFMPMEDCEEACDRTQQLIALFDAVCSAPDLSGSDALRWRGRGWKVANRDVDSPLRETWMQVCDEGFVTSRAASEQDWQRILSLREPARLELRAAGQRVAMRFRGVSGNRLDFLCNGELRSDAK
jgi:hypothetical protein